MTIVTKIFNRLCGRWQVYCQYRRFFYPVLSAAFVIAPYYKPLFRLKHRTILNYLEPQFLETLKNVKSRRNELIENKKIDSNSNVWVLWLQGREQMPLIVKKCVESIEANSNGRKVVVLSLDDVKNYVNIPEYIYAGYRDGRISAAHISDIIRMALLSQYGGFWIDSTVFLSRPLPDYSNLTFYSIKRHRGNLENVGAEDGTKWTSYFMGCGAGNFFITVIYNFFLNYWLSHTKLIDYFLIDYSFALLYKNCEEFRRAVNIVPFDNEGVSEMLQNFNEPYSDELWNRLMKNGVSKLTYKMPLKSEDTIARKLIKKVIL